MSKVEGRCLCGAVTYSTDAEPAMVAICHCTECQRQSGSAFSVNVGVPTDQLSLAGDSLRTFQDKGSSGQAVRRLFCNKCGSPLVTQADSFPGVSFVKAGTLNDASWVKPDVQIWCDSAQPWGKIGDDLAAVPQNPPAGG